MKLSKDLLFQIKQFAINSMYRLNCLNCIYYGFSLYKIKNRITWEGEYLNNLNDYDYIINLDTLELITNKGDKK